MGSAVLARWLRRRLSERALLVVLAAAWAVFYAVFFTIMTSDPVPAFY